MKSARQLLDMLWIKAMDSVNYSQQDQMCANTLKRMLNSRR